VVDLKNSTFQPGRRLVSAGSEKHYTFLLATTKNVMCYSDQLAWLALTTWTSERNLGTFYQYVILSPLPKYSFCL